MRPNEQLPCCSGAELREEGHALAPNNLAILTNLPFCRPTDDEFHRRVILETQVSSRNAIDQFVFQILNECKLQRIPITRDPSDRYVLDVGKPRQMFALLIQGTGQEHFPLADQPYCSSKDKAPFIGCVTTDNISVLVNMAKSAACASCIYMGCEEECFFYQAAMAHFEEHGTFYGYQFVTEESDVEDSDRDSDGAASATGSELLEQAENSLTSDSRLGGELARGIAPGADLRIYDEAQSQLLGSDIHPDYYTLFPEAIESYMTLFCDGRWHMAIQERFNSALRPEWNLETFHDSEAYSRIVGMTCVGHVEHGPTFLREIVYRCVKDARNKFLDDLYRRADTAVNL